MHRKYSNQLKGECIEMYVGLGMTSTDISKKMKVPAGHVLRWVDKYHRGRVNPTPGYHRELKMIIKKWS